jgi:D-tagatose-1,6-bisphosphate aldolase subunit GatZ/KbaZ
MTPKQFVAYVEEIAQRYDFPREKLILGGDHLGPGVWQAEPAAVAMDKARTLVRDCVVAGYTKIHLDASMKCGDDDPKRPLNKAVSAARAAELCQAAEDALAQRPPNTPLPHYVIGTEVPLPGGEQEAALEITVSSPVDTAETIALTRDEFLMRELDSAWERVIAVVVQPGVEFGDDVLFPYDPARAVELSCLIEKYDHLVYEAHSTDYQTREALRNLVKDHFAILKVGPALTFAFREAVFALAMIEEKLFAVRGNLQLSRVRERLEEAMLMQSSHWKKYYQGTPDERLFARQYSFSDRSRYYWPVPEVQRALALLMSNLESNPLPLSLFSQYVPAQYERIRNHTLANTPRAIILDKIATVLDDYAYACQVGQNKE